MENNKKSTIVLVAVIVVVIAIGVVYFIFPDVFKTIRTTITGEKPKVVKENLVIPDTQKISGVESRSVTQGPVAVPLVPKTEDEKVIVEKAVLTVKGSYNLAVGEAKNWTSDAKLAFVKSLGAVTLDGKSSQWQLAFSSKTKKNRGYEIIIQGDQIVSKKEIDSKAVGADLPQNWQDSDYFVKKLQERPAFSDAMATSFLLSSTPESTDTKWWFSISTSKGTVTFEVK